ncbi:hypothetical protein BH11MYX1_BH11MYX1_24230 [soil metagenome]
MVSVVRRFALRVAVLCILVAGVFATHLAVAKPRFPFVVLAAIDRAFSPPRAPTILDALAGYEADLLVACDAASEALDRALAQLETVAPERRTAALLVTMKHLELARGDLAHAPTAEEFVEYDATCERLRDVRRRLS